MVSTGVSAFKNAYKSTQRSHKERSQLKGRKNLGLLEKHRDYKLRANDFNKKRDQLKKYKRLARDKNPDAFYFRMINEKTDDGIHFVNKVEPRSAEHDILSNTRDINYLNSKIKSEESKITQLESKLHFTDLAGSVKRSHILFVDDQAGSTDENSIKNISFDTPNHSNTASIQGYNELSSRIERLKKLKEKRKELLLSKNIKYSEKFDEKYSIIKNGQDEDQKPVYRWHFARKR